MIEEYRGQNDPTDREQAETSPIGRRRDRQPAGHLIDENRHGERGQQARESRTGSGGAEKQQPQEQHERDRRRQGREPCGTQRIV